MTLPRATRTVPTGWQAVDGSLGSGLVRGALHEWFGVSSPGEAAGAIRGEGWSPPLFLLTHLAKQAVLEAQDRGAPDQVVWIGRNVWPYPRALSGSAPVIRGEGAAARQHQLSVRISLAEDRPMRGPNLLDRSLFVAPDGSSSRREAGEQFSKRLWAIDTALRCPGVTAVVADGTGLTMAATRRLQLAGASTGALVLLARPPHETGEISALVGDARKRRAGPLLGPDAPARQRSPASVPRFSVARDTAHTKKDHRGPHGSSHGFRGQRRGRHGKEEEPTQYSTAPYPPIRAQLCGAS
jgi:hypothetical protein